MNPNRKYWSAVSEEGEHVCGNLFPTLRETFDTWLAELGKDKYGLAVVETSKEDILKRLAKEPSWVHQLIDLRDRAIKKPIRRESMTTTMLPVDGIKVEGWGIHLVLGIDEGEYYYSLFAVRFDGDLSLKITSSLSKVLMALGAIPLPDPQIHGNTYHFFWKADLDPPVDA